MSKAGYAKFAANVGGPFFDSKTEKINGVKTATLNAKTIIIAILRSRFVIAGFSN